jgi:hypothetical protein
MSVKKNLKIGPTDPRLALAGGPPGAGKKSLDKIGPGWIYFESKLFFSPWPRLGPSRRERGPVAQGEDPCPNSRGFAVPGRPRPGPGRAVGPLALLPGPRGGRRPARRGRPWRPPVRRPPGRRPRRPPPDGRARGDAGGPEVLPLLRDLRPRPLPQAPPGLHPKPGPGAFAPDRHGGHLSRGPRPGSPGTATPHLPSTPPSPFLLTADSNR